MNISLVFGFFLRVDERSSDSHIGRVFFVSKVTKEQIYRLLIGPRHLRNFVDSKFYSVSFFISSVIGHLFACVGEVQLRLCVKKNASVPGFYFRHSEYQCRQCLQFLRHCCDTEFCHKHKS